MAKESGRKAAQWIKQEHAELFQVNNISARTFIDQLVNDNN